MLVGRAVFGTDTTVGSSVTCKLYTRNVTDVNVTSVTLTEDAGATAPVSLTRSTVSFTGDIVIDAQETYHIHVENTGSELIRVGETEVDITPTLTNYWRT